MKLDDIKSESEIEELSIKELKRVLLNNFVDYKGCCERWELQERVKRLWNDNELNKKKGISLHGVFVSLEIVLELNKQGFLVGTSFIKHGIIH